jgi:hypothetical protein
MDLVHWIKIQRLGFNAAGLTGRGSFDRGVNTSWTGRWGSGGPDHAQARQRRDAGGERRRGGAPAADRFKG